MTEATTDALQQMARHVATQLVVDALKDMVANVPSLPVTVTLHPQPLRRLLPPKPAKRRGRKAGSKPKLRKSQRKVDKSEAVASSAAEVSKRRCRNCKKLGTAEPGRSAKELRCNHCGHRWQLRLKADERRAAPGTNSHQDRCTRCDHTKDEHDGAGKCLSHRCSCTEFYN